MRRLALAFAALALLCAPAAAQTISRSQTGAVGTVVNCTDPNSATVKCVLPMVTVASTSGTPTAVQSSGGDAAANALVGSLNYVRPSLWNGSTWDRAANVAGVTPNNPAAVAMAPTANSNVAMAPTVTSASASSLVVKASPGNLYSWRVTAGASAGYALLINATSAPADGAVAPLDCVAVAANSTVGSGPFLIPERYTAGITIVFSTTGCFTKTASATAYIRATAQ